MKDKKKAQPKKALAKAEKKPSVKKQLATRITAQLLQVVTDASAGQELTKDGMPKGIKLKKIIAKAGKKVVKQLRDAAKHARKTSKESKTNKESNNSKAETTQKATAKPQAGSIPVKAAEAKPKAVPTPKAKDAAATAKAENVSLESAS